MNTNENLPTYEISETAERLRNIRALKRMTQGEAAVQLGIRSKSLSAIERGEKGCSVDLFIRMRELYDVSLDYLILGKDAITDETAHILDEMEMLIERMRRSL